jgi:hypothetical protein
MDKDTLSHVLKTALLTHIQLKNIFQPLLSPPQLSSTLHPSRDPIFLRNGSLQYIDSLNLPYHINNDPHHRLIWPLPRHTGSIS